MELVIRTVINPIGRSMTRISLSLEVKDGWAKEMRMGARLAKGRLGRNG